MSPHAIFLGIISLLMFGGSLWIFFTYQRSASILAYCGLLLGLSLVAAASALTTIEFSNRSLLMITRFGYLTGVLAFSMVLVFSWYYPVVSPKIPQHVVLFWTIPIAFFLPYILFNPNFVQGVEFEGSRTRESMGSGFWVFPAFVIAYAIGAVKNLIEKIRITQGTRQLAASAFLIILSVSIILGVFFDVVLPALGYARTFFGVESSMIFFALSIYIVLKK